MKGTNVLQVASSVLEVKLKKFADHCEPTRKGDWIDLRSRMAHTYKKGDKIKVHLGVAMELPEGYEAHVVPRSSAVKHFKVFKANGAHSVIDNAYSGPQDEWWIEFIAFEDGEIKAGERVCQFKLVKKMPEVKFIPSNLEHNDNRGGHGSTGKE